MPNPVGFSHYSGLSGGVLPGGQSIKATSSPASPPLTSGSDGVMVEKRRHRSDRYRLLPVSAVCSHRERLHTIRVRPPDFSFTVL